MLREDIADSHNEKTVTSRFGSPLWKKRLDDEYEWIGDLVSKSDIVSAKSIVDLPLPPRVYEVTFECRGLVFDPTNSQIIISRRHKFQIDLPFDYPRLPPRAYSLTSDFHPNIDSKTGEVSMIGEPV